MAKHFSRKWRLSSLAAFCLAALLCCAGATAAEQAAAGGWENGTVQDLRDFKVTLSKPRMVGESSGFLWFPSMLKRPDGDLIVMASAYRDDTVKPEESAGAMFRSSDGGLNWTALPKYQGHSCGALSLPSGEEMFLPYQLFPREDGAGAPCYFLPPRQAGEKEEVRVDAKGVLLTGLPRQPRLAKASSGAVDFVFESHPLKLKDGNHLVCAYGHLEKDEKYTLLVAESQDARTWKYRSTVAGAETPLRGSEGPCEAALARLKDGRIMCVFRMGGAPYGQTYSSDEGRTWTKPAAMSTQGTVEPSLVVMEDGAVALSGGRNGLFLWLNADGTGGTWETIDILKNHNASLPDLKIKDHPGTSAYTEIVALDAKNIFYLYDRLPNGWDAIPSGSDMKNSLWVVRATVEKK